MRARAAATATVDLHGDHLAGFASYRFAIAFRTLKTQLQGGKLRARSRSPASREPHISWFDGALRLRNTSSAEDCTKQLQCRRC